MNWNDWYTDTMSIYRTQEVMDGSLTRHERALVSENIPCRIYQSDNRTINMTETASNVDQSDHLACDISVDVRAGDEIIVKRGGRLGRQGPTIRAFAGDPNLYYEPFGAIIPGLAHQEIRLLQQERVT
jgi:hypothetical protein|nr:MAG TPA: hypothetical protein [Caudoviricetes sp.]